MPEKEEDNMETKELTEQPVPLDVVMPEEDLETEDAFLELSQTIAEEGVFQGEIIAVEKSPEQAEFNLEDVSGNAQNDFDNGLEPVMEEIKAENANAPVQEEYKEEPQVKVEIIVHQPEGNTPDSTLHETVSEEEEKFEELTVESYHDLGKADLVKKLEEALAEDVETVKNKVRNIKEVYIQLGKDEYRHKLEQFVEDGGLKQDFHPAHDPLDDKFFGLLDKFEEKKTDVKKKKEQLLHDNLEQKRQVIEELKALLEKDENVSVLFKTMLTLQEKWRSIGFVPTQFSDDLWKNYQFYRDKFYDKLKMSKELRELDQRKNFELKKEICEKAEDLLVEKSINRALDQLNILKEKWKSIGPAPKESNEQIWERFKSCCDKMFERRREHVLKLEGMQAENLANKILLCEMMEAILDMPHTNRKQWLQANDKVASLMTDWKKTGYTSKKVNEDIWKRFKEARDTFFHNKEIFFKGIHEAEINNLHLKTDLCTQAESLKDNTDWKTTTDMFIKLQNQWKNIGAVPQKQSNKIWHRFRDACDAFFNNKKEHFAGFEEKQAENMRLKEELIAKIEQFQPSENATENIEQLKQFQSEWLTIDHVPIKFKEKINDRYRKALDKQFDSIKLSAAERSMVLNLAKAGVLKETPKGREKLKYMKGDMRDKIHSMESEIALWENNIGFFGKSKNADKLKLEFQQKIDKAKEEIKNLKAALKGFEEE